MASLAVLGLALLALAVRSFWRLATVPKFRLLAERELDKEHTHADIERRTAWPICGVARESWVSAPRTVLTNIDSPFWTRTTDGAVMSNEHDVQLWRLVTLTRLEQKQPETKNDQAK